MKKLVICLILLIITLNIYINSFAVENKNQDSVYLDVSKTEIKSGEEFSFTINLANIDVSAFDIEIYFNNELLEYISGPENTNVVESKIITVWYDETGGKNAKQNCELVKYTFKAKEIESEYITIQGEFYDSEGNQIQSYTDVMEIIANKETQTEFVEVSEQSQVASNNSKLQNLRLNHEGVTPEFSPDITEYYFLTENLNELEVIAIPQNSNSNVVINGNTNFKEGLNTINIEITSSDKTSKTQYKIYVTKTKDLEKANANLETLAFEGVNLEPEFSNDIYQYNAVVSNTTQNLNMLAIPEKQNAKIEVVGGQNLQYGNNLVTIKVIAENGYTTKNFKVNVYKRNEEEQKKAEEEVQINAQKLSAILQENEEQENKTNENIVKNIEENLWFVVLYIVFCIIIIGVVIYRVTK